MRKRSDLLTISIMVNKDSPQNPLIGDKFMNFPSTKS